MGLFGSKKKVNETSKLICKTGDAGSYKCMFLAAYRNVSIDVDWETSSSIDDKVSESLHLPSHNQYPCIKENDFVVCRTNPVLTYLNIKGKAPTIHPRKARVLAAQQYWIQVLTKKFEPLLSDISSNSKNITTILEMFDENLADKNYIVGEFSLADIHWAAIFKVLEDQGQSNIFTSYQNLSTWLSKMKKEISAYDVKGEQVAA